MPMITNTTLIVPYNAAENMLCLAVVQSQPAICSKKQCTLSCVCD